MNDRLFFTRIVPASWFGRLLSAFVTLALVAIGAFFLVFALVAAALIAAGVLARIWWISRKLRKQRDASVIEGSFTVETGAPLLNGEQNKRDEPTRNTR
jgi:hypothetical protein